MKIDEFDAVECNEAFAAIALMWQKEFDYPMERFNPRGGAIALGHPLGASGVALMTRLLRHLEATGGRFGFQTMCEGGGQANAHRHRASISALMPPTVSGPRRLSTSCHSSFLRAC